MGVRALLTHLQLALQHLDDVLEFALLNPCVDGGRELPLRHRIGLPLRVHGAQRHGGARYGRHHGCRPLPPRPHPSVVRAIRPRVALHRRVALARARRARVDLNCDKLQRAAEAASGTRGRRWWNQRGRAHVRVLKREGCFRRRVVAGPDDNPTRRQGSRQTQRPCG
jgi:hypothetical protein